MVDSNDQSRLAEAREELHNILADDEMRAVPVCVIANKQDLPQALSPAQVVDGLGLHKLSSTWHVQGACALNADGIYEAMNVLARMVKDGRRK